MCPFQIATYTQMQFDCINLVQLLGRRIRKQFKLSSSEIKIASNVPLLDSSNAKDVLKEYFYPRHTPLRNRITRVKFRVRFGWGIRLA